MNCYTFETLEYEKGIYDESIDCTYILTMENSFDRHKNIKEQLKKCVPTKKIYIVINKGFSVCEKNLKKNISNHDLIHANLNVFKHANGKKYSNILVLEDDFYMENRVNDNINIKYINNFCLKHKDFSFSLSLGSGIILMLPYSYSFHRPMLFFGTQAMIHSQQFRKNTIKNEQKLYKTGDWDNCLNFKLDTYSYNKPLITQTFPETENQKNWGLKKIHWLTVGSLKLLKMDKRTQPGWDIVYFLGYMVNILLFVILILIINYIFNFYLSKK